MLCVALEGTNVKASQVRAGQHSFAARCLLYVTRFVRPDQNKAEIKVLQHISMLTIRYLYRRFTGKS